MLEEQLALLEKHVSLLKAQGTLMNLDSNPLSFCMEPKISKADPKAVKPKKALNAFGLYMAESMNSTKALNPLKNNKERIAALAKCWGSMPADEKEKYELISASLQVAHIELVAAQSVERKSTTSTTVDKTSKKKRKLILPIANPLEIEAPSDIRIPTLESGKKKVTRHHSFFRMVTNYFIFSFNG